MHSLRSFAIHPPSYSVGLVFFTMSLLFGSWFARLPEMQAQLGLGEGGFGLVLLSLPLGAMLATQSAGFLLQKLPLGSANVGGSIGLCLVLILPTLAPSAFWLVIALFLVGLVDGFLNVAMNAAANELEEQMNVKILSTCHGMFSFGAMIGALGAGYLANLGVSLTVHFSALAFLLIGLTLIIRPILLQLPNPEPTERPTFAWPSRAILGIVLIGMFIMLAEGTIADWSAIYLSKYLGASPWEAGLGFAGFSLTMAIGRFSGDHLRHQWGARRILYFGTLIAFFGYLLALCSDWVSLTILGFTIVGIGLSVGVPVVFSEAARRSKKQPGVGIAAVATFGLVGFLGGPPLVGLIAEALGLDSGLAIIGGLLLVAWMMVQRQPWEAE